MIDDDLDQPEDFEKEHVEKPSLKEIWDNNPPLKLVAIVLGAAVLLGVYVVFFNKPEDNSHSKLHLYEMGTAKQVPGKDQVDPAYRKALEEANKKDAEEKAKHGESHLDVPIAIANNGGLEIPKMPETPRSDVLEEWKRVADAGRMKAAKEAVDEENAAPAPEVVPMVQPIRPQEVKQDPNMSKRIAEQMRVIIAAQVPPKSAYLGVTNEESPYTIQKREKQKETYLKGTEGASGTAGAAGTSTDAGAAASAETSTKTIVAAGSIAYAQLLTTLNSDLPGPVLAQMLSGPFAGGRLIGKLTVNQDCQCLVISFKTVVKDTVSYKIDAVALDESTTLAGVNATSVDNHYMVRYVLPAAASFLTGYSQALSQTGQTETATSGVGTQTATSAPSPKQSIFAGITSASQAIGNDLNKGAQRPVTIVIAKGTTMGVFFTDTVTTKDATK